MINYKAIGILCHILSILLGIGVAIYCFIKGDVWIGVIWALYAVANVVTIIIKLSPRKENPKDKKEV